MIINADDILSANILIVDDQRANVRSLEQMLRDVGYQQITPTMDPFAICTLHRDNHYDLILLDLQMPGMDSLRVMADLKEVNPRDVTILVVTAQPDHTLLALTAGAKDFISKPFDLVEVKTRIHNILEARLLYKQLENHNQVLEQSVLERTVELRKSEARFRRLTELASDWYWEQDESGSFTEVYGPAIEMLGIPVDSLPGEPKDTHVARWYKTEYTALEAHMAARRPFLDYVYSRINAAGARQYFQVSGEPMFDASGRFAGYRGVGRDVTALFVSDRNNGN